MNTGGDGQAKSGSAGEERSPGDGRSFVGPVDTGGAMVTPEAREARGRHGWMVESLADLMVWAIGWSREDANKLL